MSLIKPIFQNLMLLTVLFMAVRIQAQVENISISKEVKIDRLYAGLLTYSGSSKNTNHKNASSIQLGTKVRFLLAPKTFQITAFGVFKATHEDKQFIRSYEAIVTPTKNIAIHFGVMATPTTELRPNPTTWQSQVATNSESNIIGGRTGVKINYSLNKNLKLSYGLHKQNNSVAHHLKVAYKQLAIASYLDDGNLFVAIKWQYTDGNMLITRDTNATSMSSIVPISEYYKMYVDMEYNTLNGHTTYLALGIRRNLFKNNPLKGFLSLSYSYPLESFQGGIFIHI